MDPWGTRLRFFDLLSIFLFVCSVAAFIKVVLV